MNNKERLRLVSACKYVDEVAFDTPYAPTIALLDSLNADFAVHGDDLPVAKGATHHAFWELEQAGRFKTVKRTEGVSTTTLISRLLSATAERVTQKQDKNETDCEGSKEDAVSFLRYLSTSSRLAQFSNLRTPRKGDRVVYVAGDFDIFHAGHVDVLEAAKKLGDFLLVGVWDDETVRKRGRLGDKGVGSRYFPAMGLQERVVSVLSCKLTDDVVIGAPWHVTKDLLKTFNVCTVVCVGGSAAASFAEVPKSIIHNMDAPAITAQEFGRRVAANRSFYEHRTGDREERERIYRKNRSFVEETTSA
eukprot:g1777.t1